LSKRHWFQISWYLPFFLQILNLSILTPPNYFQHFKPPLIPLNPLISPKTIISSEPLNLSKSTYILYILRLYTVKIFFRKTPILRPESQPYFGPPSRSTDRTNSKIGFWNQFEKLVPHRYKNWFGAGIPVTPKCLLPRVRSILSNIWNFWSIFFKYCHYQVIWSNICSISFSSFTQNLKLWSMYYSKLFKIENYLR